MILAVLTFGPLLLLVFAVYWYTSPTTYKETPEQFWIREAKRYFINHVNLDDWTDEQIQEYLGSLYKLMGREYSGKEAVKEDMSYWERE